MLTQYDIAVLNMARLTLRRLAQDIHQETPGEHDDGAFWEKTHRAMNIGRFAQTADAAEDALFMVLNIAHNYLKVPMSEEQLHARPAEVKGEPEEEPEVEEEAEEEEPEGIIVGIREDGSYHVEEDSDRRYDLAKESGEL